MEPASVKTRVLILSDTHGEDFESVGKPLPSADVAIHCGDLTNESKLEEIQASLRLLLAIDSPLKLVIAGNHDFTLDVPMFMKKVASAQPPLEPDLVQKVYGAYGEARDLLHGARSAGIIFLDEGNYSFALQNGASLTVFASPCTPSKSDWGFQYNPDQGHDFDITPGTNIVVTHGPPHGILDRTDSKQRAGCPHLFAAVARARPRIHCFGHIHEAWGTKLVTWRDETSEKPSHFADIDNDRSTVIGSLSAFAPSKFDSPEEKDAKLTKGRHFQEQNFYLTSHCAGDPHPLDHGS